MRSLSLAALLLLPLATPLPAQAADRISILFVGNSYTFGRVDPVMSYNTANVRDLTNIPNTGGNAFEPHPWGGVAGIFQQFTVQAGLNYDVAMSTRNAASLRGHFLNTNGVVDLRSNISSQTWNQVVLQEQSDEPLLRRTVNGSLLPSNPSSFIAYADKIEDFIHQGTAHSYVENTLVGGTQAACVATGLSSGNCSTNRVIPANAKASAATQVYLYQTWARPNLVAGGLVTSTNSTTGAVTRTTAPVVPFFADLEAMTTELATAYQTAFDQAALDGTGGFAGIAPVGQSFMRAVTSGVATRNMYASNALSDGLVDLWFDDGTHASKYGSYLSALTLFGTLTGRDPASLGGGERAAADLGISRADALALQRVASDQLGFAAPVPEPASLALFSFGLLGMLAWARRRISP